jgi:multisubunit Na+/H+ antiporter MnhF subunit
MTVGSALVKIFTLFSIQLVARARARLRVVPAEIASLLACLVMILYDIVKKEVYIVPAGALYALLSGVNVPPAFIITRFITSRTGMFWREFITAALQSR